ncbi:hypothetical protein BC938DRAFT_473027 [Jimgerdemannia flammicorona]|uniref:Uncharacterized protein n=1 Tax=Jimgerdemannia flammicorona TaxID=994334 RepID=A0A433Q4Y1_9FUNG|nr:hypothetical protein BC938DRAFT_473027 [Jimgerdemannia flammicorona]
MTSSVSAIACSPSGRYIACGTYGGQGTGKNDEDGDGFLRVFDICSSEEVTAVSTEQLDVNLVSFSPNEIFVASCGTNNQTVIYDWRFPKQPLYLLLHQDPLSENISGTSSEGITGIQWIDNGNFLLTGGADGCIHLWNLRLQNPLVHTYALKMPVCRFSLIEEDLELAVGVVGGAVQFFSGNDKNKGVTWNISERNE